MALKTQVAGGLYTGSSYIAYKIDRSARRKRTISFFLESESSLRIQAPLRTPQQTIDSILQQRLSWIVRKTKEFKSVPVPRYDDGAPIFYLGYRYELRITFDKTMPRGCYLSRRRFTVNLHDATFSEKEKCEEVKLEVMLWLKKRARAKFEKRLRLWSEALGVSYKKLVVSSPDRRWGSCNSQNVIRLNWKLMMAPLSLIDYVVVHELCHIIHKNHAPRFWRMIANVMPDYEERQNALKSLGPRLAL